MPKGKPVPQETRRQVYTMHVMGESAEDIASAFGLSAGTVRKIIRDERKVVENEMHNKSEKVVAGDRRNGRLVSTSPNRYEGTCVIAGKAKSKSFVAVNANKATEMWEEWCRGLRDEQAFVDMCERRRETEPEVDITPAPTPEIVMRPWKEVAEERQTRIAELEVKVAEMQAAVDFAERGIDSVVVATEQEEPKLSHWFNKNGSFSVVWKAKPIYLLWAKGDAPRCFGVYESMDKALKEVDKLNEVAAFFGNENAFEVEEVPWR